MAWEVCPICGKKYMIGDKKEWCYRLGLNSNTRYALKYFCSWKCMRKAEQEKEKEK